MPQKMSEKPWVLAHATYRVTHLNANSEINMVDKNDRIIISPAYKITDTDQHSPWGQGEAYATPCGDELVGILTTDDGCYPFRIRKINENEIQCHLGTLNARKNFWGGDEGSWTAEDEDGNEDG